MSRRLLFSHLQTFGTNIFTLQFRGTTESCHLFKLVVVVSFRFTKGIDENRSYFNILIFIRYSSRYSTNQIPPLGSKLKLRLSHNVPSLTALRCTSLGAINCGCRCVCVSVRVYNAAYRECANPCFYVSTSWSFHMYISIQAQSTTRVKKMVIWLDSIGQAKEFLEITWTP